MEANFMSDATSQTVYFYNRHPISCEIILTKLRASRGHLDGLRPEELFPHDQDHYGGLAATDELARACHIGGLPGVPGRRSPVTWLRSPILATASRVT